LATRQIPQEVLEVINDPKADPSNITAASTNFWILASALKMFVDNEGRGKLPVNGSIPDMTAETKNYIALQNVYKNKADADVAALRAHAQALLKKVGKDTASITDDEVISYAKNAAVLRVLRFRSLTAERDPKTPIPDLETMTYGLEDTKENAYHWYFLLRAVERFRVQHGHFPAHDVNSTTWEDDIAGVKQIVQALLEENGIEKDKISDDHIVEMFVAIT
jgi:amyloid beta precursor protein binding protein 1